jgi:hypothetical protein
MASTSHWVSLAYAVATLTSCGVDKSTTYWEDPICADPPHYSSPVILTAFVGLFLEDGTPLCRDDATITLVQSVPAAYAPVRTPLEYSTTYFARVTDDWAMHLFSGGDGPCNVYAPRSEETAYGRCTPLQYDVRLDGCESVSGTFTRNDNWFPWKDPYSLTDTNWFVPIVLHCSDPPVWPPVDASVPAPDASSSDASVP